MSTTPFVLRFDSGTLLLDGARAEPRVPTHFRWDSPVLRGRARAWAYRDALRVGLPLHGAARQPVRPRHLRRVPPPARERPPLRSRTGNRTLPPRSLGHARTRRRRGRAARTTHRPLRLPARDARACGRIPFGLHGRPLARDALGGGARGLRARARHLPKLSQGEGDRPEQFARPPNVRRGERALLGGAARDAGLPRVEAHRFGDGLEAARARGTSPTPPAREGSDIHRRERDGLSHLRALPRSLNHAR